MVPDFVGFMSLVKGLYAKGRIEESRGILREMFQCKQVVELINIAGDEVQTDSLVGLLSSACEEGRIDEVVTILSEVRLMSVSSSDSHNCNMLAHLKKPKKIDDACDPRTDSDQVLNSVAFDVSGNGLDGSSESTLKPMTERIDNLCISSDDTDIDNANLLGKSFYDDFDTYYPAIASLCSKGELLKASKAIEAMIRNSGYVW
jgi:leucine-rich PPR motif-containing protein